MYRRLALLVVGVVLLSAVSVYGQNAVLSQMYGSGVHAFFAGKYVEAHGYLTSAIQGETKDPRCYYFRGLVYLQLGREQEAQADFRKGAELETADVNKFFRVGRALQRVQGRQRLMLEQYRTEARMKALQRDEAVRKTRYEAIRQEQGRVLQQQAAPAPEAPVQLPTARQPADEPAARPFEEVPAEKPIAAPAAEPAAEPAMQPAEKPADANPFGPKPEPKPEEKPADASPFEETKPEAKPEEKPADASPFEETKPEAKPEEKPADASPFEETKPEAKPEEKPADATPFEETKPDEKPADAGPGEEMEPAAPANADPFNTKPAETPAAPDAEAKPAAGVLDALLKATGKTASDAVDSAVGKAGEVIGKATGAETTSVKKPIVPEEAPDDAKSPDPFDEKAATPDMPDMPDAPDAPDAPAKKPAADEKPAAVPANPFAEEPAAKKAAIDPADPFK